MGKIIFNGPCNFSINTSINVAPEAVLEFGSACSFGNGVKIRCWRKISFGNSSWIALDTQVFDTNFHYLLDLGNGEVENHRKEVFIGDYVWVGNRCTIGPFARIPNHTVVASNSLVNKDFTNQPHHSVLLAGVPSKIISTNKVLIFDLDLQKKIDQHYYSELQTFYLNDFSQYNEDLGKLEDWSLKEK